MAQIGFTSTVCGGRRAPPGRREIQALRVGQDLRVILAQRVRRVLQDRPVQKATLGRPALLDQEGPRDQGVCRGPSQQERL